MRDCTAHLIRFAVVGGALLLASACRAGAVAPGTAGALPAPGLPAMQNVEDMLPNATVKNVVDGDTIDVILGAPGAVQIRLRLIGINTPETHKPNSPIECYGPEASQRLHELLPVGTAVRVLGDHEVHDIYGRTLAYVFRDDDLFVNLALAREGFAQTLSIAPNTTFASDFSAAVAAARSEHLGMWAACSPAPSKPTSKR